MRRNPGAMTGGWLVQLLVGELPAAGAPSSGRRRRLLRPRPPVAAPKPSP